ncbi:MAG: tRNA lysidine(34) synthetase TilS [Lysobacterales bacterium CG02_land_8_20_14_3_00_62_12]|nr:MAG: tRNA lysidine(34) synthetase TilS [Xanthomonadales bacterium CG02_land_8_20_14_3_00_62_12]
MNPNRNPPPICPIQRALRDWLAQLPLATPAARLWVAYSGGIDSTVLLHALNPLLVAARWQLGAVHVDHGLHADSARWAEHCRQFAIALGVPLQSLTVQVQDLHRHGPEAAARRARYTALESIMQPGDYLLTAHHSDDQAETFLLRALRSAGLDGLAAMRPIRRFGPGHLGRPLLDRSRAEIADYADRHRLRWIEDPSNTAVNLDRNYLRQKVLPMLRARWPQATRSLADSTRYLRAAQHAAEAEIARQLLAASGDHPDRIDLSAIADQPADDAALLLKSWVIRADLPAPPPRVLHEILKQITQAASDRGLILRWPGAELRRYRQHLYAMRPLLPAPGFALSWHTAQPLDLPDGRSLCIDGTAPARDLNVRSRVAGCHLRLAADRPERELRLLFQEHGIPPWQRERAPYLYAGEQLLAVAPWFIQHEFGHWLDQHRARLGLTGKP